MAENGAARKKAADDWMSVGQAARALGIAYGSVLTRAVRGDLDSRTFAGRTFISRASVERVLQASPANA